MTNMRQYHAIVEQAITQLGLIPTDFEGPEPGIWYLRKGSALVTVEVYLNENNSQPYCRVYCPFMNVPLQNTYEFYKELLELNMQYIGVTFGIIDAQAYLKVDREAEGMDVNEMYLMLTRVGNLADEYDDKLKEKYGVVDTQS